MSVLGVAILVSSLRLLRLRRLITSGVSAPGRTGHWFRRAETEATEVIGQRRLLRWTIPGLAYAFTFWGFIVLIFTIIEAIGDLFKSPLRDPGHRALGCARIPRVRFRRRGPRRARDFHLIRLRGSPQRLDRRSRFYGSQYVGRLDHVVHDLSRHRDLALIPGRGDQHRRLPVRMVGVRVPWHQLRLHPLGQRNQSRP